jgi:hypothetical protein
MKKKLLITFFIAQGVLVSSVSAQVAVGLKAGLNFARLFEKIDNTNANENNKIRTGVNLGLVLDYTLSEQLGMESGLLLQNKGNRAETIMDVGLDDIPVKINTSYTYLDIPLGLKYTFYRKEMRIALLTGIYAGVGLAGQVETVMLINGNSEEERRDVVFGNKANQTNPIDYGVNMGFGIKYNVVGLDINYGYGLANLSNVEEVFSRYNRFLSFSFTYQIIK